VEQKSRRVPSVQTSFLHDYSGSANGSIRECAFGNIAAATWFSSATAAAYGGQFSLSLPVTFTGSVSLGSVSAVLASSAGNSPHSGLKPGV
jgi:hypothetical protein